MSKSDYTEPVVFYLFSPTVPCVPTGLAAERTCGESSVEVTWAASRGAQRYAVTAVADGHRAECSSNGTTCTLQELMCGQVYSVTMVAINDDCSTAESAAVTLNTGKDRRQELFWISHLSIYIDKGCTIIAKKTKNP